MTLTPWTITFYAITCALLLAASMNSEGTERLVVLWYLSMAFFFLKVRMAFMRVRMLLSMRRLMGDKAPPLTWANVWPSKDQFED